MKYVNSKSRSLFWRNTYYVLIILGLVVIAGFLLVSNWRIYQRLRESLNHNQVAETNLKELGNRENELKNKVSSLQTENGLDKEIRERFPVAKPGEEVIMIVKDNNKTASDTGSVVNSRGRWSKFLEWIKP